MTSVALLSAWRRSGRLSDGDADELRSLLLGSLTLPRRGWHRAVRDEHHRVVGIAIDLAAGRRLRGPAADVVFSALLLRARAGDATAKLVLEHARRRMKLPDRKVSSA